MADLHPICAEEAQRRMADVINLNRARKAKAKAEKRTVAAANRTKHGRTKAERMRERAEAEKARTVLDGAKLEED